MPSRFSWQKAAGWDATRFDLAEAIAHRSCPGRRGHRGATSRLTTRASPAGADPTRRPSPWPIPSWLSPGTCSPTVPSTKTPVLGISSSATIRPLRRSGSNAGSSRSPSRSRLARRRHRTPFHTRQLRPQRTGTSLLAPTSHCGQGHYTPAFGLLLTSLGGRRNGLSQRLC